MTYKALDKNLPAPLPAESQLLRENDDYGIAQDGNSLRACAQNPVAGNGIHQEGDIWRDWQGVERFQWEGIAWRMGRGMAPADVRAAYIQRHIELERETL